MEIPSKGWQSSTMPDKGWSFHVVSAVLTTHFVKGGSERGGADLLSLVASDRT